MGRYSVKRYKTKRRTKDLDLIHKDLSNPETIQKLKQQEEDENLPGLGQYYCIHCDKYFLDNTALKGHLRGKVHKRRVKELSVNPYTNLEAEAAVGTNLEKFIAKVEEYKQREPLRLVMEKEALKNQTEEYDIRDRKIFEELYPEKVQQELEQKQKEAELAQKRSLKLEKKYELEPLTDDEDGENEVPPPSDEMVIE